MEPIIEVIQKDLTTQLEDYIVKVVQEVGIDVNKERLIQAFTDAKSFYDEGYADGQNQWISVKDKLPEENKSVLLYAAHEMWCGSYRPTRGWVVIGLGISGCVDDSITHWMPLPEPPTDERSESKED